MPNKAKRPAPKQQSNDTSNKRSCFACLLADAIAKDDEILTEISSLLNTTAPSVAGEPEALSMPSSSEDEESDNVLGAFSDANQDMER